MVRSSATQLEWDVIVTGYILSGRNPGSTPIHAVRNVTVLDAFDYAIHAMGYFRHAIQDGSMGVSSITIDVINGNDVAVETIEIVREP